MRAEFIESLRSNEAAFSICLPEDKIQQLADHYELLMANNARLHLVAPCSAAEMATRHYLESLTMLEHLPPNAKFADVGSGGGFPAMPCLIVRQDLSAALIESKEKKIEFLKRSVEKLGLSDRVSLTARQFSETDAGHTQYVTCRALDKFSHLVPRLVKWAGKRRLLFFGGEDMFALLQAAGRSPVQKLMPLSERRYLYFC